MGSSRPASNYANKELISAYQPLRLGVSDGSSTGEDSMNILDNMSSRKSALCEQESAL